MIRMMEQSVVIKDEEKNISLLFMGDFCPLGKVQEACLSPDYEKVFSNFTEELRDKDLSIANLECPLTTSEKRSVKEGPNIKADPIAVKMAKGCDIDVLSLGNNHILDFGEEGLFETIQVLEDDGIRHLGAGRNLREAGKPLILEKKGVKVAFLSFCETEFNIGSETEPGCAPTKTHDVSEAIQEAKHKADIVILLLHCGSEHYPLPSPRIKKQARIFAESGASAVICHHTHNPEGFEIDTGIPIFYGLGNFIFGYRRKRRRLYPYGNEGLMVRIDFNINGAVGFKIIPYCFDHEANALLQMDKSRLSAFLRRLDMLNQIIQDDRKLEQLWKYYSLRRYKHWYSPTLKKARLYFWKNKVWRNTVLWHNRTNESHNDVITTALDALRKGSSMDDKEMKTLLDEMIGSETHIMKIKRLVRAWI